MPSIAPLAGSSSTGKKGAAINGNSKRRKRDEYEEDGAEEERSSHTPVDNNNDGDDEEAEDVTPVGDGQASPRMLSVMEEKELRDTRNSYRDLNKDVNNMRHNMPNYKGSDLVNLLESSSQLLRGIQAPQDGVLDSRFLVVASTAGTQMAQQMDVESGFDIEEFMRRAARLMGRQLKSAAAVQENWRDEEGDRNDGEMWNWQRLGRKAAMYSQRVVTMDHL